MCVKLKDDIRDCSVMPRHLTQHISDAWQENLLKPAVPTFRVRLYSNRCGKLFETTGGTLFLCFLSPYWANKTLIIDSFMTLDLDKSYLRRGAVKMKKKTENVRFLKGKPLSSLSTNTLPWQLTLFHETLIWIKGQRSKNQLILFQLKTRYHHSPWGHRSHN